jgi:hypothetical protein
METLIVSEQQPEQTHGEGGSVGTEPAVHTSSEAVAPVTASASESGVVEAPAIAPPPKDETPKTVADRTLADNVLADKIHAAKVLADKILAGRIEADRIDAARVDPVKIGAAKADAQNKADARKMDASLMTGKLMIMSPGERTSHGDGADANVKSEPNTSASSKRWFAGMAAVVALAVLAGAVSGALATVGVMRFAVVDAASTGGSQALETSVSRLDADIAALKAGLEQATNTSISQFNKTNDRLDKIEKAQAEPSSKLAKLSEAMDRLRVAPPAAPAAVAAATPAVAKDATGLVTPSSASAAVAPSASSAPPVPAAAPKTEVARLPTVDGWVLRDINHGGALIEGRQGLYEVYAGDPVPGLGRVDAIRKQDGRWVVVTSKGLVVAR